MKKSFLLAAAVLTAAVSTEALESMKYPKFRCSDRFDFEKRINLTAYHVLRQRICHRWMVLTVKQCRQGLPKIQ